MNLLRLTQELVALAETGVVFDQAACLHRLDAFSDCQACVDVCPAEAIQPGPPPVIDAQACGGCRACLAVCPTGAYGYKGLDETQALLRTVRQHNLQRCELLCERNPNAARGLPEAEVGLQVRGCLAGLGAAAYLLLVSEGLEQAFVRLDACANCPWTALPAEVGRQVVQARRLLATLGRPEALVAAAPEADSDLTARPLWKVDAPPRSRRDIFRLPATPPETAVNDTNQGARFGQRLGLLRALRHFPEPEPEAGDVSLAGLHFASLSMSEDCTACGTCARACPTGALQFHEADQQFEVTFNPPLCIACDLCDHVCAPKAIRIDHGPSYWAVFGREGEIVLQQGRLKSCERCHASFAARGDEMLCPVCSFRRDNPFGSRIPPGVPVDRLKRRGAGLPAEGKQAHDS